MRVVAYEIGQRFAEYDQAGKRRRHVETLCAAGTGPGDAEKKTNGWAAPTTPGVVARASSARRAAQGAQRGVLQPL
ncbi:hypothetical protein CA830_31520 [Burkholderia multivorans]|nr:hypothetical protein CA830_31520 [Burkholderia multivorans]